MRSHENFQALRRDDNIKLQFERESNSSGRHLNMSILLEQHNEGRKLIALPVSSSPLQQARQASLYPPFLWLLASQDHLRGSLARFALQ